MNLVKDAESIEELQQYLKLLPTVQQKIHQTGKNLKWSVYKLY
jgi:hypothetical protein